MNIQTILSEALGGNTVSQMSQQIGADESTTSSAIQAALPILLGAMAQNSSTNEGASSLLGALDRDHDGSVLDDVAGFIMNSQSGSGAGILGHILGGNQGAVEQGISQASGLDAGKVGSLLVMLAPLVMGALGRANRQQGGFDAASLAGLLGQATQQTATPDNPLMGILSSVMDSNRDGSAVDDVFRLVGGFLGGRR